MGKPRDPDYFKKYYQEHKADMKSSALKAHRQHKLEAYRLLGNKCACCDFSEVSCLQIDHKYNDGHIHRRELNGGSKIYRYVVTNWDSEKDRFQLLCGNCHNSKTQLGQCYHKIF